MKLVALALVVALAGCVNPAVKEFGDWSTANKARVTTGEIKWSDHYREAYKRLVAMPTIPGKADAMEWANILISAADLHEDGRLGKTEFETIQRNAQVAGEQLAERQSVAQRQAMGQALQNYGNARYGPEATKAQQIQITPLPPTINCRTVGKNTTCTQY